jgi:hypothetical protein
MNAIRRMLLAVFLASQTTSQAQTGFTKVTNSPPAGDTGSPCSTAWGDYDNDGFIDLLVANAEATGNWLYHNQRDGTFARITTGVLASTSSRCRAGIWGDFDNDGNLGAYFCNGSETDTPNLFYRNLGGGQFVRVTEGAVLKAGYGNAVTCQDYDNDGYLDLWLPVCSTPTSSDWKNALYHNQGDGSFVCVTTGPLTQVAPLSTGSAAWGDYDNDGRLDLVQAILTDPVGPYIPQPRVFHNEGDGRFTSVANGITQNAGSPNGAMAWADCDNDGRLDLYMISWDASGTLRNVLLRNQGDGAFTRQVLAAPNSQFSYCTSACWGDFDNDGWLDLFVVRDTLSNTRTTTPVLFHNNGDGTFSVVAAGLLVEEPAISWTSACGDYDNDGFLDLVFDQSDHLCLYHNNGNSNQWLTLRLVGTTSNRSAMGARVRVKATINGKTFWQMREIAGGRGPGQDDPRPHFGLGDATVVEVVRIEWPSGIVQEFTNVPARQILAVTEPVGLKANAAGTLQFQSWNGMVFEVQSSSDCSSWKPLATVTNLTGTLEFSDPEAPRHDARFYRVLSK